MEEIVSNSGNVVKVFAETFEDAARQQIVRLANYPAYQDSVIRIMPDVHAGKGCTIGTTMTIGHNITPNLVGVDIGCGMLVINLYTCSLNYDRLDEMIRWGVPSGHEIHDIPVCPYDLSELRCAQHVDMDRALLSLGTLGGGNHFIEVNYSVNTRRYFLVIHTGSRKLGVDVCKYYQDLALRNACRSPDVRRDIIVKLKREGRQSEIQETLSTLPSTTVIDKDLVHLSGKLAEDYLHDMAIVQRFASRNRAMIADFILSSMGIRELCRFETIHNYIDFRRMILRKGSVSAEKGEQLLIPINMRDGSLLCIGKGNPDWNYSAPHGAGRKMSRSKARESITLGEYKESMRGVYSTSVSVSTIDEAPQAYKSMEEIVRGISDTVDVVDVIKPVYNFKASES